MGLLLHIELGGCSYTTTTSYKPILYLTSPFHGVRGILSRLHPAILVAGRKGVVLRNFVFVCLFA